MASGDDPVARPRTVSGLPRTRWPILAAARRPTSAGVGTMTTCMCLPRGRSQTLEDVGDLVLERLGLGAEDRLDVVADLDHAGGAERLEAAPVDLVLVGDLHPEPGNAGVDVDQVLPAPEGGDELLRLALGLALGRRRRRRRCRQHRARPAGP